MREIQPVCLFIHKAIFVSDSDIWYLSDCVSIAKLFQIFSLGSHIFVNY